MALSLTVPKEYGYVVLAAASTSVLNLWLGSYVGSYRKAARVPYPNAYATATEAAASKEKYLFNCAQRSHAQFLEQLPPFLVTLLVSGLKYPVLSAGMGAFWVVCRVFYAIGYTRPQMEGGKGRYWGAGYYIPTFALLVMSGMTGWSMVSS
ncbi:hypothetical protein MMC26_006353 [Xylographa opegraphella]|nr:hypothetical protein [Xylographa opegraphella]